MLTCNRPQGIRNNERIRIKRSCIFEATEPCGESSRKSLSGVTDSNFHTSTDLAVQNLHEFLRNEFPSFSFSRLIIDDSGPGRDCKSPLTRAQCSPARTERKRQRSPGDLVSSANVISRASRAVRRGCSVKGQKGSRRLASASSSIVAFYPDDREQSFPGRRARGDSLLHASIPAALFRVSGRELRTTGRKSDRESSGNDRGPSRIHYRRSIVSRPAIKSACRMADERV